jgi:hypothetical protein
MTVQELIKKLKRYKPDDEVCLLDHRCLEAFPTELTTVRKATKKESDQGFYANPVIID